MNPDDVAVWTTSGEPFTYRQAAQLAWMIYVRFGRNYHSACAAWSRLLENNTDYNDFVQLVQMGEPDGSAH